SGRTTPDGVTGGAADEVDQLAWRQRLHEAAAFAQNGPAGENEQRVNRGGAAELVFEILAEPLRLAVRLVEPVLVLAPRVGEGVAVVDDFVGHEADARAAFAAGFGFDGKDAGGSDDDVVDGGRAGAGGVRVFIGL